MPLLLLLGDGLGRGPVGLQTLVAPDDDAAPARPTRGYFATRTLKASPRAVGCPGAAVFVGEEEEREEEEGGDQGGFWVLYGWRRRRLRRLPPLIPSLRLAGSAPFALLRERTADGRLVVSMEPAPPRKHVVATRAEGRLVLDIVERYDNAAPPLPCRLRRPRISVAQEPDSPAAATDDNVEEATPERATARRLVPITTAAAPASAMLSAVGSASPPRSPHPAVALPPPLVCSEHVIRLSSSLPKMPMILTRMVH